MLYPATSLSSRFKEGFNSQATISLLSRLLHQIKLEFMTFLEQGIYNELPNAKLPLNWYTPFMQR